MATPTPSLDTLGQLIVAKRGEMGVRAAAREVGVSPATLSRVENGHLPDLHNFELICRWLGIDPSQVLGFQPAARPPSGPSERIEATVHFRKKATTSPATAQALAEMILRTHRALAAEGDE